MKVLVVGDVIIDKYSHGRKLGVSAETPTIVAEYERKDMFVGGAGLVCRHLLRLGCDVALLTVTGYGESIDALLYESSDPPTKEEMHRFTHTPFVLTDWQLTRKHRYYVDDYKLLQYDVINRGKWTPDAEREFLKLYEDLVGRVDAVVFCDNRHGIFTESLAGAMVYMSGAVDSFVDCQVSQSSGTHRWFKTARYFLLNEKELLSVAGEMSITKAEDILEGGVILKRGDRGAATRDQIYVPVEVKAIDTCGAGDAFLAAVVARRDIMGANRWAALSCTYKGTIVPRIEDEATLSR